MKKRSNTLLRVVLFDRRIDVCVNHSDVILIQRDPSWADPRLAKQHGIPHHQRLPKDQVNTFYTCLGNPHVIYGPHPLT